MKMIMTLFTSLVVMATTAVSADQLIGFDKKASSEQRQLEAFFDRNIKATEQAEWLKQFSKAPHHAGSRAGKEVARSIAELFSSWGYDTQIEEYEILLPTPLTRHLEMVSPTMFTASLREDSLVDDPSTSVREGLLPPYNAFSTDGNVEGELVFINYGRPEDHELLEIWN